MKVIDEFTVKLQNIGAIIALDEFGVGVAPEAFSIKEVKDELFNAIRLVLCVATQDEPIYRYPVNWWEHFKLQVLPRWLQRRFPVRYNEIIARHTFPELHIPDEVLKLGREFVTIKILEPK